jgi:hypothetical protein
MSGLLYAGSLAALLAGSIVISHRRHRARETQRREAVLAAAVARLQQLCAPRFQTLYEAPLVSEEAERMQAVIGFGAAMERLRRRTSWRQVVNSECPRC